MNWLRLGHVFADRALLSGPISQIIELCSSSSLQLEHFDVLESRRIQVVGHFDGFAADDVAKSEIRGETTVATGDADAHEARFAFWRERVGARDRYVRAGAEVGYCDARSTSMHVRSIEKVHEIRAH